MNFTSIWDMFWTFSKHIWTCRSKKKKVFFSQNGLLLDILISMTLQVKLRVFQKISMQQFSERAAPDGLCGPKDNLEKHTE